MQLSFLALLLVAFGLWPTLGALADTRRLAVLAHVDDVAIDLLMGELSYRPGLTCGSGVLCREWRVPLAGTTPPDGLA